MRPDTHTEVVGIVEMPKPQDQFAVLPTEALRGQKAHISWPWAWLSVCPPPPRPATLSPCPQETVLPPALASSNLLVSLGHCGF